MSPYLVLLILELFPARLATLPYGLDSNVTKLLANLLTKPSVFYFIFIFIKKDWQCKAGRWRLTPYQSEDPSPTLPINL